MLKKVLAFNGSPRKGWNTDLLLQSVLDGCKSRGAQTKLIHLNDINFKGCQSCLTCKRAPSNGQRFEGKCVMNDGLTDIIKEIKECDAFVVGSPIYFGMPSSLATSFLERAIFSNYSYTEKGSVFGKKIKTGLIFSMNLPKEIGSEKYSYIFDNVETFMKSAFGSCESYQAFNTLQVKDYTKYDITVFDGKVKHDYRDNHFPVDLQEAFQMGERLVS